MWHSKNFVYSSKFSVPVMIGQQKYAQYQRPMTVVGKYATVYVICHKKLALDKQICLSHKNWLIYIYKSGSNGI